MAKSAGQYIVIATLLILSFTFNANAGYVIKNEKAINAAHTNEITSNTLHNTQYNTTTKQIGEEEENQRTRNKNKSKSGWEGTASMYCAIFGLLVFPPGLIAAIILGALGLGEGKKHRGRAIVGLIIGITSVFLIATLLVLLSV